MNLKEEISSWVKMYTKDLFSYATIKVKCIMQKQLWQGLKFTISHFKHEFVQQYKMNTAFPAVFIKTDTIKPFVTKEEIETCQSLQQLKDIILFKTSMHDQHNYSNI